MHAIIIDQDRNATMPIEKTIIDMGHTVTVVSRVSQALDLINDGLRVDMLLCRRQAFSTDDGRFIEKINEVRRSHVLLLVLLNGTASAFPAACSGECERIKNRPKSLPGRFPVACDGESFNPSNPFGNNGEIIPEGIDDVITLPPSEHDVKSHLKLGARIIALENELNQKYTLIKRNYNQLVQSFVQLAYNYDNVLGGHGDRAGRFALEIAQRHPNVKTVDYPLIETAGRLHDIGLLGLPKGLVALDRTEMTGDQLRTYRDHPERGENILTQVDLLKPAARIIRYHHEQYNGRGFPEGLAADKIPLTAQIISAASLYDLLVNIKKPATAQIIEAIQQWRGYQLSVQLVEIVLEVHLAHLHHRAQQHDELISLEKLREGMMLSRDVLMKSGAFCMAGGHRLDQRDIEKLKQYYQLGNINAEVFISK